MLKKATIYHFNHLASSGFRAGHHFPQMNITTPQRAAINQFVKDLDGVYSLEQYLAAGKFWAKDSTVWRHIQQSGTGQLRLVCWYNNTHRPGSNEWRPAVIIQAALAHLKLPYSNAHVRA